MIATLAEGYSRGECYERAGIVGSEDSLCEALIRLERNPMKIMGFRESFMKLNCGAHFNPNCPVFHIPSEEEVKTAQWHFILDLANRDNPVVLRAISGEKSVEQELAEVAEVNRGWRRYTPRRKNEPLNERVINLAQVIGYEARPYLSKGIFYPDNPMTCAALAGAMLGVANLGASYVFGFNFVANVAVPAALTLLSASLPLPIRRESCSDMEICTNAEANARYVDRKIRDLFGYK